MIKDLSFYLTVAVVAIVAVVAFKFVATTPAGGMVPGLTELAAFI